MTCGRCPRAPRLKLVVLLTTIGLVQLGSGAIHGASTQTPAPTNLAHGKTYLLEPAPNYHTPAIGVDTQAGDSTDLTDGWFVSASDANAAVVGWIYWPAARITIALEPAGCVGPACPAISEIFSQVEHWQMADGDRGIYCPRRAVFEVSEDGHTFHVVQDIADPSYKIAPNLLCRAVSHQDVVNGRGGPDYVGISPTTYNYIISSGPLVTRGAFVRLTLFGSAEPSHLTFVDEVEVLSGTDSTQTNYRNDFEVGFRQLGSTVRVFETAPSGAGNRFSLPVPAIDVLQMRLSLAGGEAGAKEILISNPYPDDCSLVPTVSGIPGQITLRQPIDVPTPLFEDRADALLSIPSGLRLAAGVMSRLWIDVKVPAGMEPGSFPGNVELAGTCSGVPISRNVGLQLDIRPFSLPEPASLPTHYYIWSYSVPESEAFLTGALADEAAELEEAMGANTHISYFAPALTWTNGQITGFDFSQLDEDLNRYRHAPLHILLVSGRLGPHFGGEGNACFTGVEGDPWDEHYATLVRAVRDHMLASGYRYDEFALYPVDEPNSIRFVEPALSCPAPGKTLLEYLESAARIIRQVDPALQIFANVNEQSITNAFNLWAMDLVDTWVVPASGYYAAQNSQPGPLTPYRRFFDGLKRLGHPRVETYNFSMHPSFVHADPSSEIRIRTWQVFRDGFRGYGFWSLFNLQEREGVVSLRSPWRTLEAPARSIFSMIYLTRIDDPMAPLDLPLSERIIPSRRLLAWRQSIDDSRYLQLLLQRIQQTVPEANVRVLPKRILADIDKVVADPTPVRMDAARDEIARKISLLNP